RHLDAADETPADERLPQVGPAGGHPQLVGRSDLPLEGDADAVALTFAVEPRHVDGPACGHRVPDGEDGDLSGRLRAEGLQTHVARLAADQPELVAPEVAVGRRVGVRRELPLEARVAVGGVRPAPVGVGTRDADGHVTSLPSRLLGALIHRDGGCARREGQPAVYPGRLWTGTNGRQGIPRSEGQGGSRRGPTW